MTNHAMLQIEQLAAIDLALEFRIDRRLRAKDDAPGQQKRGGQPMNEHPRSVPGPANTVKSPRIRVVC